MTKISALRNEYAVIEKEYKAIRMDCGPSFDEPNWSERFAAKQQREAELRDKLKECEKEITQSKATMPYSDDVAMDICERISSGELLINICKADDMPLPRTVMKWKAQHAEFAAVLKRAIGDRLDMFEEQIIQISDHAADDLTMGGKPNNVAVTRCKVMIDTRLRHLRAYRPERWGEAVTVRNVDASEEDLSQFDDAQLEQRIADLDAKERIVHGGIIGRDVGSAIGELPANVDALRNRRPVRDLF